MAVKLILLDLDGTLLTRDKRISERNYAALESAARQGVHIVPSTGRFFAGMPKVVRELPFYRYAVSVNGAEIYDTKEKRALHREEIPPQTAQRVFARLDTLPVIYDCFLDGWGYMDSGFYEKIDEYIHDEKVADMVKELRIPVEGFKDKMSQEKRSFQKIQMFFKDNEKRLEEWKRLSEEFKELIVTSSIYNNVELNAKNANKGAALRFLCAHLGICVEESMAFGDSSNDLSMILEAGIGVAMENASQEIKDAADYITDTNDRDGVAKAIERFCLEGETLFEGVYR